MSPRRCWIAVASAEHALRGRDHQPTGFMQVCHGKQAPLKRLRAGDLVAYYAPARTMEGKDGLQSFVAIGEVQAGDPYLFDMGGGFEPYRRDVRYWPAKPAPIAPLLDRLLFIENRQRWGYKFRFGLFEITTTDMRLIASAMGVQGSLLPEGPEGGPAQRAQPTSLALFE